ncbi:MAG TPA: GNAT family N-acetyltransferase [Actinocatenispora sp.]
MSVIVRPARPEEYEALGRITVGAYHAADQIAAGTGYDAELADCASRAAGADLLAAVDDETGAVLGGVTFCLPGSPYAELARPDEAEFRMLAVDPAAQGRGVGAALVAECVARAARAGRRGLVLCTRDTNSAAQRLYERFEFEPDPARDWAPVPGVTLLAWRRQVEVAAEAG